jgi:hypothetical protein
LKTITAENVVTANAVNEVARPIMQLASKEPEIKDAEAAHAPFQKQQAQLAPRIHE